jgi:hypothetical protein
MKNRKENYESILTPLPLMGVQNIHILGFRLFEEDCRMKIPII